jgi:hypothetical protein
MSTTTNSLKEFCSKYKELANELVRCGSCTNILLHSGDKYEIVTIGQEEESVLCETCKQNKRNVEMVTRVSEDNNHVFQIPVSQLNIINITSEETEEEYIE